MTYRELQQLAGRWKRGEVTHGFMDRREGASAKLRNGHRACVLWGTRDGRRWAKIVAYSGANR